MTSFPEALKISLVEPINDAVDAVNNRFGDAFHDGAVWLLRHVLVPFESALRALPWWLVLAAVFLLSLHATRRWPHAIGYTACVLLVGCLGLWDQLLQTLALVIVATLIAVALALPLGILSARSDGLRRLLMPLLDVMQTMPSFVYLVPVLMLFGLGKVPAILATIIYATPPLIRLTDLGIRQVSAELTEAALSFGATRWQLLIGVQLPLARPSIMAGLNQTIMMALGMVVVASMIGARGLGEDVLEGIQTVNIGRGLQAGIAIVILAIVMDRITQGYGRDRRQRKAQTDKAST
ncbi:glycine betaine/proline transport system permease protein [Duganella sp. SG902]|uniref:ABC transporter permease n=1 Tax=Duganella sp. SG902 TaxID=2587016 RepID=UPI00159DA089|nr:proline/glycine betaine ABC transporter permease [Duganella sp. SG902]NVM77324.1 glycine betaine/proline transport system permease protein [Duganella sp. SG902]